MSSTELLHTREVELKDVKFQNDFSVLTLDLPICISKTTDQFDIVDRLNLISKKTKALGSSFHYSVRNLVRCLHL